MTGILVCILALVSCWAATRRALGLGLGAVMAWGYAYGIVRANWLNTGTYFAFDAAVLGFYAGYRWGLRGADERRRTREILGWLTALVVWPVIVAFIPLQTPLVTLVGLRGNIFFLPFLLVGARLRDRDLRMVSCLIAVLNLGALTVAGFEYVWGVQRFYPVNAVTSIIYNSSDVAGNFLRIPATFVTAHAFGGTMVATIPLLFGTWCQQGLSKWLKLLILLSMAAAALGTLLSATRVNFVVLVALLVATMLWGRMGKSARLIWIAALLAIVVASLNNERLQRFKSLSQTDSVASRIGGSVNRTFFEIVFEYPMGNGIGGGGTSIPAFLQSQLRRPIEMESEYARILLEQGVPGLILWISFIAWYLSHAKFRHETQWQSGRMLTVIWCASALLLGALGLGMMTSIPQTIFLLLSMGWTSVTPPLEERTRRQAAAVLRKRAELRPVCPIPA